MTTALGTVDREEIARFDRIAAEWWDPDGMFRPLHRMNPVRLDFIRAAVTRAWGEPENALTPLTARSVVDIGCGGGLLAEPLARLGGAVTAIDAAEETISVARAHAEMAGLAIDYRVTTAEALAETGVRFDLVTALEIIEHVADPAQFLRALAALVKPDGIVVISTLNRTPVSFLKAILGAEHLLRWVPRGTHEWRKFLRPSELAAGLRQAGLNMTELSGMAWDPARQSWSLAPRDLSTNYILVARPG